MPSFCEYCQNLLCPVYVNDVLAFKCQSCNLSYPSTDKDTLRRETIKETDVMLYSTILKKAAQDPVTIKVKLPCKKCDNDIIKQVRMGDDLKLYNVCPKCNTIWGR